MYKRNTLNVLHRQSKFNTPKMDGAENWWVLLFLQITLASRENVCLACFPCLILTKGNHKQFTQICYGDDSGWCRYRNSTLLKSEDTGFWFVSALKLLPGKRFVSLAFRWSLLEITTSLHRTTSTAMLVLFRIARRVDSVVSGRGRASL